MTGWFTWLESLNEDYYIGIVIHYPPIVSLIGCVKAADNPVTTIWPFFTPAVRLTAFFAKIGTSVKQNRLEIE
jgi:hypothetical protein